MKNPIALILLITTTLLAACSSGPESPTGFSLPKGDVRHGRSLFLTFQCHTCHTIEGINQLESGGEPGISVMLGGEVSRIKTYAELVTSVINPSHRLAKGYPLEAIQVDGVSKMRNYNDAMTVSQLIDLVAFLESEYKLERYPDFEYPVYDLPSREGQE
ncbi:MAG: hypothetical protein R3E62_03640 [Pseudomonadales bacterium]|jgi:mono/diheme cytochrome c family protein